MASPCFLTDYPYLFEFLLNSGEELAGNILKSTTLETGGNAFLSSLGGVVPSEAKNIYAAGLSLFIYRCPVRRFSWFPSD